MAEKVEEITLPEALQIVFECIAELKARIEALEEYQAQHAYQLR